PPAWTELVPAHLRTFTHRFGRARAIATRKLQLRQFPVLLAMDVASQVQHRLLGLPSLLFDLRRGYLRLGLVRILFDVLFRLWIWQRYVAALNAHEVEVPDSFVFYTLHHVLEHGEGFLLVLDQRILLTVST